MYFWDEKKQKLVKKCPSCSSLFFAKKGTNCPITCPAWKTEIEHKKIAKKMIAYCFSKKKILANTKNYSAEQTLNHHSLESLKAEFNQSQRTAQIVHNPPKNN